jgi:hypothetical protein
MHTTTPAQPGPRWLWRHLTDPRSVATGHLAIHGDRLRRKASDRDSIRTLEQAGGEVRARGARAVLNVGSPTR